MATSNGKARITKRQAGKSPAKQYTDIADLDWEFVRDIEIVVRRGMNPRFSNEPPGPIVARLGIVVSAVEAERLCEADLDEIFHLSLAPAENAVIPEGMEWNERVWAWVAKDGDVPRGPEPKAKPEAKAKGGAN